MVNENLGNELLKLVRNMGYSGTFVRSIFIFFSARSLSDFKFVIIYPINVGLPFCLSTRTISEETCFFSFEK